MTGRCSTSRAISAAPGSWCASSNTWMSATATTGDPGSSCRRAKSGTRSPQPGRSSRWRPPMPGEVAERYGYRGRRRRDRLHFVRHTAVSAAAARARGCPRTASSTPACSRRPGTDFRSTAARGRGRRRAAPADPRRVAAARGPLQRTARAPARATRGRARSRCTTLADEAKRLSHVARERCAGDGRREREIRPRCGSLVPAPSCASRAPLSTHWPPPASARRKAPVIHTAIVAGTMAAKRTHELIPFCHPLGLERCDIAITPAGSDALAVECTTAVHHRTGVEMEALTGASVAALTLYDMCKSLSHGIVIESPAPGRKVRGQERLRCGSGAMTTLFGLVLAGGRSRRMQADKAALDYGASSAARGGLRPARPSRAQRAWVSVRADQAGEPLARRLPADRGRHRRPRPDRGHHRRTGATPGGGLAGARLRPAAARRRDARGAGRAARPDAGSQPRS